DEGPNPRSPRRHVSHLGVVGHEVIAVLVGPRLQLRDVVGERLPMVLVTIDDADAFRSDLPEPNGGRVAHPEVPSGVHPRPRRRQGWPTSSKPRSASKSARGSARDAARPLPSRPKPAGGASWPGGRSGPPLWPVVFCSF